MSKHTPGPWTVQHDPVIDRFDVARKGVHGPFAHIQRQEGQSRAETEANARLVAAAPALLEALERLESKVSRGAVSALVLDEVMTARTVIAKAKGEKS